MFALRKIIGSTQSNYALGIHYEVLERFVEPEKFAEVFEKSFGYSHVADLDSGADNYTINCYGFVLTNDFEPIPLYLNQRNYIMTESGKTFSNLTFKK